MANVALVPSFALLAGAYAGIAWARPIPLASVLLVGLWLAALAAWLSHRGRLATGAAVAAYVLAGAVLASGAALAALRPPIRATLDAHAGHFSLDALGPGGAHEPLPVRARILEDAAALEPGVGLLVAIETIEIGGRVHPAGGGVRLLVSGAAGADHASEWRAGRVIEAPVTFRRPARYLNAGVADFERNSALDGVALTGSIKSALLVDVVERGSVVSEATARIRAYVRTIVRRRIGDRDSVAAAIVIAILIGDRSALPGAIRERLQAAGTYHVIAISGGNIAILAAAIVGALALCGVRGRAAALLVIGALAGYSEIVNAGPSVWRATVTAIVYFAARLVDHRSPPWNAMAVSAALLVCAVPLEVRNVGFALSFAATAAILEVARRLTRAHSAPLTWLLTSLAASTAVEIALLPIGATAFSRATAAGVVLNLVAVPLMTVVQVAGIVLVAVGHIDGIGSAPGVVAAAGAEGLVNSARLVDVLPWLAVRVPPPPVLLSIAYYFALASVLTARRHRSLAVVALIACGAAIATGRPVRGGVPPGHMRLTVFDVGQGDAMLLQLPSRIAMIVDSGGAGVDGQALDIGGRVLAPALWARGVRTLDAFAITHGDPDHIGGGPAIVRAFDSREMWEGVPVPAHPRLQSLLDAATDAGAHTRRVAAGLEMAFATARVRILSPPPPDWERRQVRNDDSIVIEVTFGNVAIVLTGDAGAEVERRILTQLTQAPIRILKVGHHGSRTSTSRELLDAWKPQIAIISCGRGNRFGHPAPEVITRLDRAGVRVFRTDRDGQVTVQTDGRGLTVRTFADDRND